MSTVLGLIIGGIGATFLSVTFPSVALQVHDGVIKASDMFFNLVGVVQ